MQAAVALLRSSEPAHLAFVEADLHDPIMIAASPSPDTVPRQKVLKALFDKLTVGIEDHQMRVIRVASWVQDHFVHSMHTPLRPDGSAVYDPMQLLAVRKAHCGQVNRVLLDLLDAGSYQGRVVQLRDHQGAEVFYSDTWHYIEGDALMAGQQILKPDGTLPSAIEIHQNPDWLNGICLGCEETLLYFSIPAGLTPAEFSERRARRRAGDGWKDVFSIVPEYYERKAGAAARIDDPHYGWMTYVHQSADGRELARVGP